MPITAQNGIYANAAADGSALQTVTFTTAYNVAPSVALTVLNPGVWDGYQLTAALVGTPSVTGFQFVVSGGPPASLISVSWLASGFIAGTSPAVGNVPTGYTQASAIAMCQLRTNYTQGIPSSTNIATLLNAALEQLGIETEPLLLNASIAISVANSNTFALGNDVWRVRNMSYSNGLRGTVGVTEYEMVQLGFNEFIEYTDMTVASAIGGIPTVYTIIQDSFNVMTIQVYPLVSTGYINYFYSARPTLFGLTNSYGDQITVTNIDTSFQEPAILWTCARMCEARQNMNQAQWFDKQFKEKLEAVHMLVKRRARLNGSNVVRDVSEGESVTPFWVT